MFWNVIDKKRYEILDKVIKHITIKNYYMAGGTALSIQAGFRESFDFDFFVMEEFNTEVLIDELEKLGSLEIITAKNRTLHCLLDDIQLTFIYFPNKLAKELIKVEDIEGLYLANVVDIAIMKLIAISQRGTKKDFFDLYNICEKHDLRIYEILELLKIKYEENKINYRHIIQSLSYFEDAEDEILPKCFIEYDWSKIKEFYIKEQKEIYNAGDKI